MKKFISVAALIIGFAGPIAALDIATMSDDERQVFRDEIRAYLLENPEVLMEAIAVLETRERDNQTAGDGNLIAANAADLFEDEGSYQAGNPDGDVIMVEFLDYRCSYCRRAHPEVAELISTDANIRYIVKEFPILGEQSVLASRFAISTLQNLGDEAYALVHDSLMTFDGDFNEASLGRIAKSLELDGTLILAKMNDASVDAVITANRELGQRMQINGTPSFVMGDQMLRGYLPLADMQTVLAQLRQ